MVQGLSEPVGALIALLVVRPTESSTMLNQYMLAFVGGIMVSLPLILPIASIASSTLCGLLRCYIHEQ